jgi:hypothetical protein
MGIAFIIALAVMFAVIFTTAHTAVGGGLGGLLMLPFVYLLALGLGTETGQEIAYWITIALIVGLVSWTLYVRIKY